MVKNTKNNPLVTAAIDLGAHSVRMLIAECSGDPNVMEILENIDVSIPLGSEVFQHGKISNDSIRMLCDIFRGFRSKMSEYGVLNYRAIATSAVREAANSDVLLDRIEHATGIRLTIYEGSDEARLDYLTVRQVVPSKYGFTRKSVMIADIGTGACQISSYVRGCLRFTETLKVGTLRVLESLPDTVSTAVLREFLTPVVNQSFRELEHTGLDLHASVLIAMGSSVRALYTIYAHDAQQTDEPQANELTKALTRAEFEAKHAEYSALSIEEISERFGLAPELAEAVIPCSILLENLFRMTNARTLLIPMVSMKHGLMRDYLNELFSGEDYFQPQILELVQTTGRKFRCDPEYSGLVAQMAELLFHKLQSLHGLSPRELLVLKIAALLHKAGLYINNQAYHKHSAYLIGATEIPGISLQERHLAAMTARYHRKAYPRPQHPEFAVLTPDEKNKVLKLSSLLRIACLLASRGLTPESVQVQIKQDRILIHCGDPMSFSVRFSAAVEDIEYFAYVFAVPLIMQ